MKITSSKNRSTLDKITNALDEGKSIADIFEVVMDKEYIETNRYDWCWAGHRNIPIQTGWFHVDRMSKQLVKIDKIAASKLQWHERMFVYESALVAAKQNSPLAIYIGDEYPDGRMSALYICGPDYLAWVAQK